MKTSTFPFVFQKKIPWIFNILSNFENNYVETKKINISNPVFVAGCPRSGTTILTEILNETNCFGSYLYKDLPYYRIPIIWNYLRDRLISTKNKKIQRIHGDNIFYNYSSPDAFEEIIWSNNLPNYYNDLGSIIDATYNNTKLLAELKINIKKILFLRKSKRYLSKGNYNLFRFKYLKEKFKDAKFIVVIRDPYQTCLSSENVHKNFIAESENNSNFDNALKFLCHFEFGNNRKVLNICSNIHKIRELWAKGNDYEGYLYQWIEIYDFVKKNYIDSDFKNNLFIFNYESFKENYKSVLDKLFKFLNLNVNINSLDFNNIKFKKNIQIKENISYKLKKKVDEVFNNVVKTDF